MSSNNMLISILCAAAMLGGISQAPAEDTVQKTKNSNLLYMLPSLRLNNKVIDAREPVLTLMSANDVDKIDMAWTEGSDGKTPLARVIYEVHLSETENFTPSEATLKKTVRGDKQTEVDGLDPDKIYYGFLEKYNIHSAAFVLLFFILILKFQSIML